MSAPNFTPGPWRHAAVEGGWDGVESNDGLICKLSLNVPVNARLIAAAPDLLEALQVFIAAEQSFMEHTKSHRTLGNWGWNDWLTDAYKLAVAAVQKATGGAAR